MHKAIAPKRANLIVSDQMNDYYQKPKARVPEDITREQFDDLSARVERLHAMKRQSDEERQSDVLTSMLQKERIEFLKRKAWEQKYPNGKKWLKNAEKFYEWRKGRRNKKPPTKSTSYDGRSFHESGANDALERASTQSDQSEASGSGLSASLVDVISRLLEPYVSSFNDD